MSESSLSSALVLGSGRVLGVRRAGWVLRAAVSAAAAAAVVVVGSSAVWAAAPVFPTSDNDPVMNESATVTLLAVGEGQTKVGPPVRAVDADGDSLTYSLSDVDPLHASFFTIDSSSGQISLKQNTRSGVYRVRVSVSDDEFDADDTDTASVDVTIHVTSPGHYPWEDAWVLARSMTASGETAYNQLGWWLDATSEVVVVGAPQADPSVAGAVYVFDADSGAQLAKLTSPNAQNNGQFGTSVAVAGDTIFVGTWAENSNRGRVYVFVKPDGGWADTSTATATITRGNNDTLLACGIAVSDDASTLAVGACLHKLVYVFTKPDGGWVDTTAQASGVITLTNGTRNTGDLWFGITMDVSGDGNTIAVSASDEAVGGVYRRGSVYVHAKPDGGWANTTGSDVVPRLSAEDGSRRQKLGFYGVALSHDGSTLVAGAATNWRKGEGDDSQIPDDYYGAAYVYVRPSGGWADATETAKLASFGHKYDQFGRGVAISPSGDRIAVGNAWSRSSNFRGSAYVYTKPAGGWSDDLDGAGDNLRVLTLADADTNPKHRYAFGSRGIAFIGEDKLVAGQSGYVKALDEKDELTTLPDGGLYGDNVDLSMRSERLPGSAHLFKLRQVSQQQPVAPPPPPPPPPPAEPEEPDEPEEPAEPEPELPEFADVDEGSVHAESIEKAAALGITSGTTATTFSPSDAVTRAQMATFLTRTWEAAGRECPTAGVLFFDDVASGSTHAAGIDCVSALGVAQGTADRTFSPSEPVTRAQMAAFLARAWRAAGRTCPDDTSSSFDDVPADSARAADIGCIAALGITSGTAAGTFSPSEAVTRAQMATFLARFHEALTA